MSLFAVDSRAWWSVAVWWCHVGALLSSAAGDSCPVVARWPGENVTLTCMSAGKPGVQYRAVRWYKESVEPRLTGLVSMELPAGSMRWYVGADTRISLEEGTRSLKLPAVNCSDGGVYLCYLAAPVGEQNREGRVRLSVTGCPTERPSEPETPSVPEILLRRTNVESAALRPTPALGFYSVCGAVGMISAFIVFFLFLLSYRCVRRSLWTQTKTPGKEPRPDHAPDHGSPEKRGLLWTSALGSPPRKAEMSAA